MFPTRERFETYIRWCEQERDKQIRQQQQAQKLAEARRAIEQTTDDVLDDDYDPITLEAWESVTG